MNRFFYLGAVVFAAALLILAIIGHNSGKDSITKEGETIAIIQNYLLAVGAFSIEGYVLSQEVQQTSSYYINRGLSKQLCVEACYELDKDEGDVVKDAWGRPLEMIITNKGIGQVPLLIGTNQCSLIIWSVGHNGVNEHGFDDDILVMLRK